MWALSKGNFIILCAVTGVLLIFSCISLGIGRRLLLDTGSTRTVSGFTRTECTLDQVTVLECTKTGGYVTVWRRRENGESVVANPFAERSTREEAMRTRDDYLLGNRSYPCMCRSDQDMPFPSITCPLERPCMLEVDLIENLQKVGGIFAMAPTTLLVVGSFLIVLVFLLLVIIASIIICQRKVQEKYGFTKEVKQDIYTVGDE